MPADLVRIALRQELSKADLETALAAVQPALDAAVDPAGVLVDATAMTGYELRARGAFVDWLKRNRAQINKVAIVTTNRLWRTVIYAMSIAAGVQMAPFERATDAERWLG